MQTRSIALFLISLLAIAFGARAQDAASQEPLRVAVKTAAPFVVLQDDGTWAGLTIELWEQAAGDLGLEYEYQEATLDELFLGVREESPFDVGVGALTITAERETMVDFTHGYFTSGLGIATTDTGGGIRWASVLRGLVSWELVSALGVLVIVLLAAGLLVLFFERKRNEEQFGGSTPQAIGSAFWWSAVTMTTVGYGDKAPITFGGRAVALVWMFTSVVVVSGLTASVAAALAVSGQTGAVRGVSDLASSRVATVSGSAAESSLVELGASVARKPTLEACFDALVDGSVDAVVYDRPLLRYVAARRDADLMVLPDEFERQPYGLALREDSPIREALNRRVLEIAASEEYLERVARVLGGIDDVENRGSSDRE